jgi:hypothetical protein
MGAVNYGAMIIAASAIIGSAVSIYNYLNPMSGIAGTPGAILVIVSTLILFAAGAILASDQKRGTGFRAFFMIGTLIGIGGTAGTPGLDGGLWRRVAAAALQAQCGGGMHRLFDHGRRAYRCVRPGENLGPLQR